MALTKGKFPFIIGLKSQRNIITGLGTTRTLKAQESGSLIVLDTAAGTTITLPAACKNGTWFEFMVGVTVTSNADKIITGAATELLCGSIINCDTDTSDAVAIWKSLVATANISVNLDGSTKGGIKGDKFKLTKINSTTWIVEGTTNGTGTVATPFATS